MSTVQQEAIPLSFGADQLLAAASRRCGPDGEAAPGLHHWLLALLEDPAGPLGTAAGPVDRVALTAAISERVAGGDVGPPLPRDAVIASATSRARQLGHPVVRAEDVVAGVIEAAGGVPGLAAATGTPPDTSATTGPTDATTGYAPRSGRPTPTLEQYGRDLTREAREGRLPPIIGRDTETELVIETICRRTKRNPALVGPAGTGKTAIVEGLAQRVVAGRVPAPLRGVRIIALQPSNLTAGAGVVGELEKRMKAIVEEASQDGIVLFIDELHSIVGSGGRQGVGDVGALLKPSIARGDIAIIGATTDDEYREFIEPDQALERRFNRVRVQEMSPADTRVVLGSHRDVLASLRAVSVPDVVLDWLLDFADQYLKNRNFPDKAVDLLEQCVAHAVVAGAAEVTLRDAHDVAERMVGMPIELGERLQALERRLVEDGLMPPDEAEELIARIRVTSSGLAARPQRPNAVLLLAQKAAEVADGVAVALAETLFGGPDRIVDIDFGQFTEDEDLSSLIGPPPGYIGFGGRMPLHDVAQKPWSVLLCRNVDGCHPEVARVLGQALADGVITERSGRRIYLSDTVVLLTAGAGAHAPVGFEPPGAAGDGSGAARAGLEKVLGADFVSQVDVVCAGVPEAGSGRRAWVERTLLAGLAERYRHRGLEVDWDSSLVDWILQRRREHPRWSDLERLVEDAVGAELIPLLPDRGAEPRRAQVRAGRGAPKAELLEPAARER